MLGFNGGLLGVRKVPTNGTASGLWFQNEQSVAQRAGIWPLTYDPYWSSVVLLLQPNAEANNSTVFTDLSSYGRTLTTNGNTKINTGITRFGKPTILADGTGDTISAADSASLELGSSDFTLEIWLEPYSQTRQYATLISRTDSAYTTGTWLLLVNFNSSTSGDILFYVQGVNVLQSVGVSVRDGNAHFIQVVRSGSNWSLNVDGMTRATYTGSITFDNSTHALKILGDDGSSPNRDTDGSIGAVRLTIGVARPNIVPTAPFPVGLDPYWSSVSLLLHMDGSNGSTTFTDSSSTPKTITVNGNAQISTAQSKYGGASGYFDGTGDYLEVASLSLDLQDFTVECWVRLGAITDCAIFNQGNSDSTGGFCLAVNSANSKLYLYADNSTRFTSTTSLSTGTWIHVALTRQNTDYKLFIDGVLDGSYTGTHNHSNTPFKIANGFGGITQLNGYIDDARVTKGVARYNANFTPPTAAFPNG